MKYQDFSSDENLVSSEDTILSFTCEDMTVFIASSVSANRKRGSQHLAIGVYVNNKQNITCPLVDTNFIFSWSCNSISHSLAALTRRYRVEHWNSKIKLVSARGHVISSIYRGFYWKSKQIGSSICEGRKLL